MDELETLVDFPLEANLGGFALNNGIVNEERTKNPKQAVDKVTDKLSRQVTEYNYVLVGVSSRLNGDTGSSHNIAAAKNDLDGKWYSYSDDVVTEIDPEDKDKIVNPHADVVFYVRRVCWRKEGQVCRECELHT